MYGQFCVKRFNAENPFALYLYLRQSAAVDFAIEVEGIDIGHA